MRKYTFKSLSLLAVTALLLFAGCQKDETTVPEDETETTEVETMADVEFSAVDYFVEDTANNEDFTNGRVATPAAGLPACATRTFNSDTHTLTIDFGTEGCLCKDGKTRRGKIITVFSGPRHTAGSSVTITLDNYYVNDNHFTGTKTKTYVTAHKMNVTVHDARVETPKGNFAWNATRVIERIAGTDTRLLTDDVYLITGRSAGINRRNVKFNTVIEQPLKLVLDPTCVRNFIAGVVKTTTENGKTLILNYDPIGGEPCDKIAELTVNGRSRRIELR